FEKETPRSEVVMTTVRMGALFRISAPVLVSTRAAARAPGRRARAGRRSVHRSSEDRRPGHRAHVADPAGHRDRTARDGETRRQPSPPDIHPTRVRARARARSLVRRIGETRARSKTAAAPY